LSSALVIKMEKEEESDVYGDAEELLEDDELSAEEEGFMRGYEED
jgi:hypothetical protein